jgi:hypothetical protein
MDIENTDVVTENYFLARKGWCGVVWLGDGKKIRGRGDLHYLEANLNQKLGGAIQILGYR